MPDIFTDAQSALFLQRWRRATLLYQRAQRMHRDGTMSDGLFLDVENQWFMLRRIAQDVGIEGA